jgi:hypothetical protein
MLYFIVCGGLPPANAVIVVAPNVNPELARYRPLPTESGPVAGVEEVVLKGEDLGAQVWGPALGCS